MGQAWPSPVSCSFRVNKGILACCGYRGDYKTLQAVETMDCSLNLEVSMMKRLVWLIPLTLLLVGVLSFAYTRNTSAAAKPASPALQMLSANYPATSLTANPDGYTTVETINFSVGS